MTVSLYILRHAETRKNFLKQNIKSFNPEQINSFNKLLIDKNSTLNETGQNQSVTIAHFFNSNNIEISAIYTSYLLRSVETAQIIKKNLDSNADIFVENILYNINDVSLDELKHFLNLFIHTLIRKYSNKSIVLITHNHIIEALYALFVGKYEHAKYKIKNCNISFVELNDNNDNIDSKVNFWAKDIDNIVL